MTTKEYHQAMKIGLDFDGTASAQPELFGAFAVMAQQMGHDIRITTYRSPGWDNADVEQFAKQYGLEIIYTDAKQKKHVWDADVWIDDMPEICATYEMIRAQAEFCRDVGDTE